MKTRGTRGAVRGGWGALAFVLALTTASATQAQVPRKTPTQANGSPATTAPTNLRAHVGTDFASRLLRSSDPDERLRGIRRAAAIGTPEAVGLLAQAAEGTSGSGSVRTDPRALVELARSLSRFTDQERARAGLAAIVNTAASGLVGRIPQANRSSDALSLEEGDPVARTELARQIAAIALARSNQERAVDLLQSTARSGGSGQGAALLALLRSPPKSPRFFETPGAAMPAGGSHPPTFVRMLGQLGDLRAIGPLHAAARAADPNVRAAAILSLAELGDERTIALARAAIAEPDARLRAAAGEAFILLAAPERFKAVSALISDEATTAIGVRLAERVHDADITKLLAARAAVHPSRYLRSAAIRALGRSPDPSAAAALLAPSILADPGLAYDAALALARSPAPNATALVTQLVEGKTRALGVRAYVVRALVRGERSGGSDRVVSTLVQSKNATERALGVFAKVALGDADVDAFVDDAEPRVRRAAAMGSLAKPTKDSARRLLARMNKETDAATRQVLAIGLLDGDPDGTVTTTMLVDRAESGGADAALSTYALARRADETTARKVSLLLGSKDPVLRANAARGLAAAPLEDAAGRLADAYAYETDVDVRRTLIASLAARSKDASSPARRATLETARDLDPDGATEATARLALARGSSPFDGFARAPQQEAAWLRLAKDDGTAPGTAYVGTVVRADGVAVPVVFDDEGFAIVPGLPPGEIRLVLAPRLPSYEGTTP